jgi:lipid-binding SYLF domain-containing protein
MTSLHLPSPGARCPAALRRMLPVLVLLAFAAWTSGARAQDDPQAKAAALIQSASRSVENFLTNARWQAVRNLLGGARAIFIVPHDIEGGFLLTASGGDGVLLRRHGESWSDPVFLHISSMGLGFEAGGQSQSLVMVIMTDSGVDQLVDGTVRMGGSGGFALADLGANASAGGSIASGLQLLTVSTSQGLFAGGGIQGTKVAPKDAYNQGIYGGNFEMARVLAQRSGRLPAAAALRAALGKAVGEAWER